MLERCPVTRRIDEPAEPCKPNVPPSGPCRMATRTKGREHGAREPLERVRTSAPGERGEQPGSRGGVRGPAPVLVATDDQEGGRRLSRQIEGEDAALAR